MCIKIIVSLVATITTKQLIIMKTVTFNYSGLGFNKGDKLEISKETKKTVVTYDKEGKKRVYYKGLFKEYE